MCAGAWLGGTEGGCVCVCVGEWLFLGGRVGVRVCGSMVVCEKEVLYVCMGAWSCVRRRECMCVCGCMVVCERECVYV